MTFDYNRFERAFDQTTSEGIGSLWPEEDNYHSKNLGWGFRRQGAIWPSVEAMLLDFDGDGLQDRVYVYPDGNECKFNWAKNRGRQANGQLMFQTQPTAQTLPRLPWAASQRNSNVEWCSLSAQFTMHRNLPLPNPHDPPPPCPDNMGTYLAYRWIDMTGDQLPDLVTAMHHDPRYFDPALVTSLGPWPACSPDPACPALSSTCMDTVVDCPDAVCRIDESAAEACLDAASNLPCGYLAQDGDDGSYDDCIADCVGDERCPALCANLDRFDPPSNGGGNCGYKVPHESCDRYPWVIYENVGGAFSSTPQVKYQPIPLESDAGDSSFGGSGIGTTRFAIQDIDGDGNLDAVIRGGYTERDLTIEYNNLVWLVFPGDGHGNFVTDADGRPRLWLVPDAAPVSASCTSTVNDLCSPYSVLNDPPLHHNAHDARGLSSIMDLTGDGAPDLLWKVSANQFDPVGAPYLPWESVFENDPIMTFQGNGHGFEYYGTPTHPQGASLAPTGVSYFSRSHVVPSAHLANHFMTEGLRTAKARFVDFDGDGRKDLLESGWDPVKVAFEPVSVYLNHGGTLMSGFELATSGEDMRWRQESTAGVSGYNAPREWTWKTTRDVVDLDGDGIPEAVESTDTGLKRYADSNRQPLRLMSRIRNGRGATIDVSYGASTDSTVVAQSAGATVNGERYASPRTFWVVRSVSKSDNWDPDVSTTSYFYTNPVWKPDDEGDWDFRGFQVATTTQPSGAKRADTYKFDVDWSGRLAESRTFESSDLNNPRQISKTSWTERTLFGGALRTYHKASEKHWTCTNGQNESACSAASAPVDHSVYTYRSLPATGTAQLHVADRTFRQQSDSFQVGDRRQEDTFVLVSSAGDYRLRRRETRLYRKIAAFPALEELARNTITSYDGAYKAPVQEQVVFKHDGSAATESAITTWTREPATGAVTAVQAPRNAGTGFVTSYVLDATKRFVIGETNEENHVVERKYEPGTGALIVESGPSSVSCGASCTNWEQHWTDIDGLGRPIATWVNREVPGNPLWQKTQTSWTTYVDGVVGGARSKVVYEKLLSYGSTSRSREETMFDGQGRPDVATVTTMGAAPATTSYDYDHRGQLVAVTVPDPSQNSAATVTYSYGFDSLGRPLWRRRPAVGGVAQSGTDVVYDGLTETREEILGAQGGQRSKTKLVHDVFGRLLQVREDRDTAGNLATTTYAYDAHDMVSRIDSPDGVTTELFQDMGGRRRRIVRGARAWSYEYNPSGELTSESVPAPSPSQLAAYTTLYGYDRIGRETTRTVGLRGMYDPDRQYFGIGTVVSSYDTLADGTCTNGRGRLCRVTFPNNVLTTSYAYDFIGNRVREKRQFSVAGVSDTRTVQSTFLPGGQVATQRYADNTAGQNDSTKASFGYDIRGLPEFAYWEQASGAGRYVAYQTRNVAGLVTRRETLYFRWFGNLDFASDWVYDPLARVNTQTVTSTNGTTTSQLAKQQLDYFSLDDPRRLRHWMGAAAYDFTLGYDVRHQLTTVSEASARFTSSYGFTAAGKLGSSNIIRAPSPPPGHEVTTRNVNHAYGAGGADPDAVTALNNVSGGTLMTYGYDTAGNLSYRTASSGAGASFTYDGEDQLRRASTSLNGFLQGVEEYFYDHEGTRSAVVSRNSFGTVTGVRIFIGDTELKYNPNGTLATSYAHISLGTPVARVTNRASLELQFQGLGGNTLLSVDPNGANKSGFVYAPYGELVETTGSSQTEQHRRYSDKYRDDLTKLSYYGARYYDNFSMSWTQGDPLYRVAPESAWSSPRRAGLYVFNIGNPVRYMDPDGRQPAPATGAAVGCAIGAVGGPGGCAAGAGVGARTGAGIMAFGLAGVVLSYVVGMESDQAKVVDYSDRTVGAIFTSWMSRIKTGTDGKTITISTPAPPPDPEGPDNCGPYRTPHPPLTHAEQLREAVLKALNEALVEQAAAGRRVAEAEQAIYRALGQHDYKDAAAEAKKELDQAKKAKADADAKVEDAKNDAERVCK